MNRKISILTPSRSRPKMAEAFASSIFSTAENKEDVEIIFYIDETDPYARDYRKKVVDSVNGHVVVITGPEKSISLSWNDIAEVSNGDILIMGNDDIEYKTPGWDVILNKKIEEHGSDLYVAWFDDTVNRENHCAFPIISKAMYECLGYFTPGIFEFLCNDTWWFEIGKFTESLLYIPEVVAEHKHFTTGKSDYDETYKKHRVSGATKRDVRLLNNTRSIRIGDAEHLINCFKNK